MDKKIIFLIVSVVGLILWTLCFFFGFNYTQNGALMVSIPVALFAFLLIGFMIFLMRRFCDPKGSDNYQVAKNTERAALIVYAVASLFTALYIGHFISVSMNGKTAVQDKVTKEIQELYRIFDMPEQEEEGDSVMASQNEDLWLYDAMEGSYLAWVFEETDNYYKEMSAKETDSTTVEVMMRQLGDSLLVYSGFDNLQHEVRTFLYDCEAAVDNWNWLTVTEKISLLEANKKEWENEVEKCAVYCQYTKNEGYKCNSKENHTDIAASLTSLSTADFSISGILLIIVLQIMMLLTYLASRPKTGKDPLRYNDSSFARSYGGKKKTDSPMPNLDKSEPINDGPGQSNRVINLDDEL